MNARSDSIALQSWWRWLFVAAAVLVLCSCQAVKEPATEEVNPPGAAGSSSVSISDASAENVPTTPSIHPSVDPSVQLASNEEPIMQIAGSYPVATSPDCYAPSPCFNCNNGAAYAYPSMPSGDYCCPGSFQPPGIAGPWPADEYICDGGDAYEEVLIKNDFSVNGLNIEDTVVHYDTVDGRTAVEPSNRVCIYAPRFAAVRQVRGMLQNERHLVYAGLDVPERVIDDPHYQEATPLVQQIQPTGEIGSQGLEIYRERLRGVGVENSEGVAGFHYGLMPYEDFQVIKYGVMVNSEKARLANGIDSAIAWTANQEVQLVIDEELAVVESQVVRLQGADVYESPDGDRMRIIKIASREDAQPGDVVDFTLRFDNVGLEKVGNVTIIDNLTARLEYVPESSTSTLDATFYSNPNEDGSLVIRWEITEPLEPGEGGVIHFQCRVR